MPTCRDCKFYQPKDNENGDCFGHAVKAGMPADKCPVKAYQPK